MNELDARYAEAAFAARNPEFHEAEKQTLLEQAQSVAKAVGTIATGIAGSAPAGIAGMATLPFKGVEGAKQVIEDITQALTYVPQDEAGQAMVQRIAGALKMIGEPAQWVGDKVNDLTGSPAAATAAEIMLDPVNLATAGAAAAIKPAAKVAGKVAKKVAENAAAPVAPKVGPGAQRGQVGWHGSPHDIQPKPGGVYPEMDINKIGTGEGAQAYGHGLYIAESKGTAGSYRVRGGESFSVDGKTYAQIQNKWSDLPKHDRYAITALADSKGNVDEAIGNLLDRGMPDSTKAADVLKKWKDEGKITKQDGHLYKVDIPDEAVANMLDWDKPLSEQPEAAQVVRDLAMKWELPELPDFITGGRALEMIGGKDRNTAGIVSVALKENGIPGIKYLDAGSRDGGSSTRNFVIFDDKLIRILEKDGKPTGKKPWDEDAKVGAGKTAKEGKK